jgi:glyoxylate/hydroxypyruvate reductase A
VPADLLRAPDTGQFAEAALDFTVPEPLPDADLLGLLPRVCVTPHIASMTWPRSPARATIANLRRHVRGEPLLGLLVDRLRGY